jgi:tetratricopeptide (TPR) repeat protein
LRLGAAEDFIRNDRPHEALEELGGRDEPPGTWPLVHYPTWYWLAGWASGLEGRNDEAIRLLERGFHLAESLYLRAPNSQRARLAEQVERLRCFLGTAYCADGQTALALQCHLQGREAIDKQIITDADLKLMIYKGLGREYLAQGRYQEAAVFYQLAIKSAHDRADQRQHGLAAWGLGLAYREQGNLQQARKSYLEALEALGAHGNRQLLAQIRALLGQVLVNLKEYEEAEHHLQRSLEGARYVKDPRLVGIALANLADLHLARGAPEQAIQAAQEGLPLVQQSEDYRSVGELQYTLALAYAAMQKNEAAERAYHAAIRTAGQISDRDILGQVHQGYADFLASQGRFQQAFAILQQMSSALPSEQSILKRDAIVSSNVGTKHK